MKPVFTIALALLSLPAALPAQVPVLADTLGNTSSGTPTHSSERRCFDRELGRRFCPTNKTVATMIAGPADPPADGLNITVARCRQLANELFVPLSQRDRVGASFGTQATHQHRLPVPKARLIRSIAVFDGALGKNPMNTMTIGGDGGIRTLGTSKPRTAV